MAENTLPKKNVAYTFYVALVATANRPDLIANPTLAGGDVEVSTDGGTFVSLTTLPVVTPASGVAVKVDLSAGEMNGDNVTVKFIDLAGAEWDDLLIEIRPATRRVEDLAFPTTTGRSLDVAATGEAGLDFGNAVGSITGGEIGVGAFAANAITAAASAADFISEIRTQADDALVAVQLDHLLHVADASTTTTNSILAKMASSDGVFSGFSNTTDALEAIRDRIDDRLPDIASLANINAEVDTALSDIDLEKFISASIADTDVADNSALARLAAVGTPADFTTFNNTTDSLEALRLRGDAAWITSVATSTLTAAQVNTEVDTALADIHLNRLIALGESGQVVNDSIVAKMVASDTPATFASFSNITDSLEGIRDNTAWDTATGFSTHNAAAVWTSGTRELTAVTAAQGQAIADEVLSRNVSNVEATVGEHTLATAILANLEWDIVTGTTWNIRRTDGTTLHFAKTLTRTASLDPVTAVD